MEIYWIWILMIVLSYLAGSFPTGYILAKRKGIDIKKTGSGATGATNVSRSLGLKYGSIVMIVDILKSFIFAAIAFWVFHWPWLVVAVTIAATIGHIFPCFLQFKGGKGIATLVGGLIPLLSFFWIPLLLIWALTLFLSKIMSLTNLIIVLTLPVFLWLATASLPYVFLGIAAILIVFFSHRENIQRIINGKESKLF
jgi:glycerol-3-phosphate acyltransferase PlsY